LLPRLAPHRAHPARPPRRPARNAKGWLAPHPHPPPTPTQPNTTPTNPNQPQPTPTNPIPTHPRPPPPNTTPPPPPLTREPEREGALLVLAGVRGEARLVHLVKAGGGVQGLGWHISSRLGGWGWKGLGVGRYISSRLDRGRGGRVEGLGQYRPGGGGMGSFRVGSAHLWPGLGAVEGCCLGVPSLGKRVHRVLRDLRQPGQAGQVQGEDVSACIYCYRPFGVCWGRCAGMGREGALGARGPDTGPTPPRGAPGPIARILGCFWALFEPVQLLKSTHGRKGGRDPGRRGPPLDQPDGSMRARRNLCTV
jgi:hypothetical protein